MRWCKCAPNCLKWTFRVVFVCFVLDSRFSTQIRCLIRRRSFFWLKFCHKDFARTIDISSNTFHILSKFSTFSPKNSSPPQPQHKQICNPRKAHNPRINRFSNFPLSQRFKLFRFSVSQLIITHSQRTRARAGRRSTNNDNMSKINSNFQPTPLLGADGWR